MNQAEHLTLSGLDFGFNTDIILPEPKLDTIDDEYNEFRKTLQGLEDDLRDVEDEESDSARITLDLDAEFEAFKSSFLPSSASGKDLSASAESDEKPQSEDDEVALQTDGGSRLDLILPLRQLILTEYLKAFVQNVEHTVFSKRMYSDCSVYLEIFKRLVEEMEELRAEYNVDRIGFGVTVKSYPFGHLIVLQSLFLSSLDILLNTYPFSFTFEQNELWFTDHSS
ncbi:hypothetical protein HDU96_000355 [Phlyctochytrium bullatum]|nr:hypothetical protein HDU96_000355 [Phlyctochytrium bullatum]